MQWWSKPEFHLHVRVLVGFPDGIFAFEACCWNVGIHDVHDVTGVEPYNSAKRVIQYHACLGFPSLTVVAMHESATLQVVGWDYNTS
jgi:hypothetical protein